MTEAELIQQQKRKIEELEAKVLESITGATDKLNGFSEMAKNVQEKMSPLMQMIEDAKKVISLKPKKLNTIIINKKKCEISLTENGMITIIFINKQDAENYFDSLTKK
jgi:ArsR family metal-binding transcriptional regulator